MAGKDQDLVLVDIEFAEIHPVTNNAEDKPRNDYNERHETNEERLRRIADMFLARPAFSNDNVGSKAESLITKSQVEIGQEHQDEDLKLVDIEYAEIHPASNETDENVKSGKLGETEKERLDRIADMFLARPAYGKRIEVIGKNKAEEVTAEQRKKIKKKDRTEQKNKVIKEKKEQKPMEAFLDSKPSDDRKKRGKLPGCFGMIRAWVEKWALKRKLKKESKKSEKDVVFSDILVRGQPNQTECKVDDIYNGGLIIDAWENDGVKRIVLN